ncbi:ATP-dependent zinc protease [Candidatus Saccharibacteria bacterium]|nr:ATP-dependent zinc protease [Candidatus Saccharibacteria bacterium]MBR2995027.1 ATP-dependent zinc protease [Candidatus Saccharibacteria bacterium]
MCLNNQTTDIIGSSEFVEIAGIKHIPAKIDTGADSSSVWASHINVDQNGILSFQLFDKKSPFYTGETLKRKDYKVAVIRSATGHEQIRYRTHFSTVIKGRKIKVLYNLSDRSKNNYPVLIGRRTITNKFLVDVSLNHTGIKKVSTQTHRVQARFEKNPYEFHQKYVKGKGE